MECQFEVSAEGAGLTISGVQTLRDADNENAFSLWVTANDVGTYDVDAQFGTWRLDGTAKLESLPNVGMLWSADRDVQVAFALFRVNNGTGLRGFSRAGSDLLTWEMALRGQQQTVSAGNVVSLQARKGSRQGSRKGFTPRPGPRR